MVTAYKMEREKRKAQKFTADVKKRSGKQKV